MLAVLQTPLTALSATNDMATAGKKFVELLATRDFAAAEMRFDGTMQTAMPQAKLRETWQTLETQVGAFQKQLQARVTNSHGYDIALVSCQFERATLEVKVVFDAKQRVAGLFFVNVASLSLPGMHSIYFTALLTTAAALAVFGTLIHKLRLPANERLLWLAAALALPLCPLAFFFVRIPLDHWLVAQLGAKSLAYKWLITFYAPLTEEPAKLIPLLISAIRRDLDAKNFVRYALAIGVGFGIGEMWFLAERVARMPEFSGLPFYQFGGFFGERLMVCVFHSAFVSVALWRLRRRLALGLAGAVALHWLGNFPLSLMAWNVGGLGRTFGAIVVQCWLVVYFAGALGLLGYFGLTPLQLCKVSGRGKLFYGRRHCPECDKEYDAPLLGLNFGPTRYERCPHCQHWHWTHGQNA